MSKQAAIYVVIPAAGSGTRMGTGSNKQLITVGGVPVLIRTLQSFQAHNAITGIIVAGRTQDLQVYRDLAIEYQITKLISVVEGGYDRQDTVLRSLLALQDEAAVNAEDLTDSWVLIHDGARCFVDGAIIDRCLAGLTRSRAVTAAVKVLDTIAVSCPLEEDNCSPGQIIAEVPKRDLCWQIQTPQGFHYRDILNWHVLAADNRSRYTDDSSISMANDCAVALVEGSYQNIKITTATDLKIAEAFLS